VTAAVVVTVVVGKVDAAAAQAGDEADREDGGEGEEIAAGDGVHGRNSLQGFGLSLLPGDRHKEIDAG
jgi:hypothetical protein